MSEETVNEYVRSQLGVAQSKGSGTSKGAQVSELTAVAAKILNTSGGMGEIVSEVTSPEMKSASSSNNTSGGGQDPRATGFVSGLRRLSS